MLVGTIIKKTVTMKVSQLTTRTSSLGQCSDLGASGRHRPCAQEGYILVAKTEQTYIKQQHKILSLRYIKHLRF